MGRVGGAGDAAGTEFSFSLLEKQVFDRQAWFAREDLRVTIVTGIERTHHCRRRQGTLGRSTPIEFEAIMTPPARQAA